MGNKIQLTPSELQAQAGEMLALKDEFELLFNGVTDVLGSVNGSWSPNLANNFSGKIKTAQRSFLQVTEMLENGAKVASTCATTFESVDSLLAKNVFDKASVNKSEYGAVKTTASTPKKSNTSTNKSKSKKGIIGTIRSWGKSVYKGAKKVYKKAKKSYEEHGFVYKAIQYGKCAIKVASATVKIVGSVATIFGTAGGSTPLAVLGIISAGNDIVNAFSDAAYVYTEQYDQVGTKNALKDLLVDSGGDLGEMLGYRAAGETVGNLVYTGIDVVSFLNGADKMLKSLGKVNTVVTGSTGYSKVWGETSFDDIFNSKLKFGFEPDYFIRKLLKVDPASTGNIIYEGAKGIYTTIKSAFGLGDNISQIIK